MKTRKHDFSIYLLKPDVDVDTALDDEHDLVPIGATNLPPDSALYLLEGESELWWPVYLGIEKEIRKNRLGAILFVRADARLFAITFGNVASQLCPEGFEREFGLRVTLNSIDPDKLSGTETLSPAAGRQRRTVLPIETDLTVLDFDQNSDVLKSLSGKVNDDLLSIFSSVSGTDYVRVKSDVPAPRLGELCSTLLKLSRMTSYKKRFPQIGKISRVTDPVVIRQLDLQLVQAVVARSSALSLTIPDLTEFPHGVTAKFSGGGARGRQFDDIYIAPYFDHLDRLPDASSISIDALRRGHKLVLCGTGPSKKYPVYKCLVFDTALNGAPYHLLDGQWYYVSKQYIADLTTDLDVFWKQSALPDYNHSSEGEFNEDAAKRLPHITCFDKTNVSPIKRHGIEPCDLLSIHGERLRFWHVKRSTLSFMLSHLFSQGANSVHILKREPEAVKAFRAHIRTRAPSEIRNAILDRLDGGLFEVRFVIVTHKEPTDRSANLPLFSKITLRRTIKDLAAYAVRTRFEFVRDVTPEKRASKSKSTAKVHAK